MDFLLASYVFSFATLAIFGFYLFLRYRSFSKKIRDLKGR